MYNDIQPYTDSEINAAMHRITNHSLFPVMAKFVFPERDQNNVKEMLRSIDTIHDFQIKVMYRVNERIIQESISDFSYEGISNIHEKKSYLFVSNHRDIMLDASLLQNILIDNGFDTTEITFGANLMKMELVVDIGKSNKMFKVERPGNNLREFYKSEVHLSEYIRYAMKEKKQSLWIAQRNGRTKDGMDRTDVGVIKMFSFSYKGDDRIEALSELNVTPVCVSYEWEPCDIQKTIELCRRAEGPYIKKPMEDIESILNGIMFPKGDVFFKISEPLTYEELSSLPHTNKNVFHRAVANLIDKRIYSNYRFYPNNYIAHDILHGESRYVDKYSELQKQEFIQRMLILEEYDIDLNLAKQIFLGIYANPIDNFNSLNNVN